MLTPPFKRSAWAPVLGPAGTPACCEDSSNSTPSPADAAPAESAGSSRLAQLDPHLHCSVIGTCLGTAELRRLLTPHVDMQGASDLDLHHQAVSLASRSGPAARALHKALDQRHAASLSRFAAARDAQALGAAWDEASRQGEIAGAYWALLTHRQVTPELRQRAFGEVHMLSHLLGATGRAELQRLVALERDKTELGERLEREQQRRQQLVDERDALEARFQQQALAFERRLAEQRLEQVPAAPTQDPTLIALHTQRREQAEQTARHAEAEAQRLREELAHLRRHTQPLGQELGAAEQELQRLSSSGDAGDSAPALGQRLQRRRVLYVGGRPSSTPAIRDLVQRHGGEFLHHDGGLEVRKGLLAAAVPGADLVVFPVDCIDHDSALRLKRLSERYRKPFLALRKASVASFAAALLGADEAGGGSPPSSSSSSTSAVSAFCLRHG